MKTSDSELFKDGCSKQWYSSKSTSQRCKNQNPTLSLNRAHKEEGKENHSGNCNLGGEGQGICARDLRIPCEGGKVADKMTETPLSSG